MVCRSFLVVVVYLLALNCQAQVLSVNNTNEGVWVEENGKKVFFYQAETKSKDGMYPRANYIHPLYGIDGAELTEDFPEDHLHHRGIFWTWHQVFIGNKAIGDAWACKDFEWQVEQIDHISEEGGGLSLQSHVLWTSPLWKNKNGKQEPFLKETAKITVHPSAQTYRIIDFTISLLALVPDLKIGGSDDQKGYGGFSVRLKTPEDITFTSKKGEVDPQLTAVDAGPWMNISGSLAADGGKAGLIIINHPDNPTYPEPWILRKKKSMQNSVYPGRHPVAVSDKVPTVLKYRLVIYKGESPNVDLTFK